MTYKLPEGWEEIKLGDVTDKIFSGGTPRTKEPSYWDGDYNWMSSGETRLNYINNTEKTITLKGIQESSTKQALKGDVVMASAGQGKTRGQTSFLNINTYINQSILSLRANSDYLYNKFLFFNLSSRYPEIRAISDSHSIRGSITTKMLKDFPINLPTLSEQKVIADTLSSLDNKIELNNKINENLEQQAQVIFKHWFIDFEFPDVNGKPYKSSGGEMIESELGIIPKGWEVNPLDDFMDRIDNRGKTPPYEKVETEFPLLDVGTLRGESRIVDYNRVSKYVSEETYKNWFRNGHPKNNDILISTVGSLAEMKLFIGDIGSIAQNVVAMRTENISPFYLYEYLKFIKNDLISYDIGTVQPSIKITHIIKHPLILPEKDTLNSFDNVAEKITSKIYLNSLENQKLSQLRDTLLPKLMSGKLRIPLD